MKTIIIGAGVVGLNIASRLVDEGHDVTVVDTNQGRAGSHLQHHRCQHGEGTRFTPQGPPLCPHPNRSDDRISHRFG